MVGVAQLAERQVVVLDAGGSSPLAHPMGRETAERPEIQESGFPAVNPEGWLDSALLLIASTP